jgi:hypothetical protein
MRRQMNALKPFLSSDNARIAAASNEDDDEELSPHVPIPEDDDGRSYHSSDEESGNEEVPAVAKERRITTPSGWECADGPDPCRSARHETVGASIASSSTRPPIRGLFGARSTTSRAPACSLKGHLHAVSAPASHAQVCPNVVIVPPNGQHAYVRPDPHGRAPPITAPDFHRTNEGPHVVAGRFWHVTRWKQPSPSTTTASSSCSMRTQMARA